VEIISIVVELGFVSACYRKLIGIKTDEVIISLSLQTLSNLHKPEFTQLCDELQQFIAISVILE
jgi:hypothetical protein